MVQKGWKCGAPLTPEQLHYMVLKHQDTANHFSHAKRAKLNRYVQRVLARNNFSVRKISISQSMPPDWHEKSHGECCKNKKYLLKHQADIVINADETFFLFHPFGQRQLSVSELRYKLTMRNGG